MEKEVDKIIKDVCNDKEITEKYKKQLRTNKNTAFNKTYKSAIKDRLNNLLKEKYGVEKSGLIKNIKDIQQQMIKTTIDGKSRKLLIKLMLRPFLQQLKKVD